MLSLHLGMPACAQLTADLPSTSALAPNCNNLPNPTRDPWVSLISACTWDIAHHSTAQPSCRRAHAAGTAKSQRGTLISSSRDPELTHPVPPPSCAAAIWALCWVPKSWDAWRLVACCPSSWGQEKSYGVGWTLWVAALSTVSENNSRTVIRKAWFTVPCQKGVPAEACLVLTGKTQLSQQRGLMGWASRTLLPRAAMATNNAEHSSISPPTSCAQIQLFLFLFGWPTVSRRAVQCYGQFMSYI